MAGQVIVDTANLQALGGKLKTSASDIGTSSSGIKTCAFGAAKAGRGYASEGKSLGDSVGRVGTWLKNWQAAIEKSGTSCQTSAASYAAVDDASVKKISAQGVNLGV